MAPTITGIGAAVIPGFVTPTLSGTAAVPVTASEGTPTGPDALPSPEPPTDSFVLLPLSAAAAAPREKPTTTATSAEAEPHPARWHVRAWSFAKSAIGSIFRGTGSPLPPEPPTEEEGPVDPPNAKAAVEETPAPAPTATIVEARPTAQAGQSPALRNVIIIPSSTNGEATAEHWLQRVKTLLESEPALLALRRDIAEGGWDRLGVSLLPPGEHADILFSDNSVDTRHPDLSLAHPLLRIEPTFLARLTERQVIDVLEHELRHVWDFRHFPALLLAVHATNNLRGLSLSTNNSVSHALSHFFLRLHALRNGDREFVDADIDTALRHRLAAFGILRQHPEPWLATYTAALLEFSLVYEAAGEPEKAAAAARRTEDIFRLWPVDRDPAAEATAEFERFIVTWASGRWLTVVTTGSMWRRPAG